jgi:hypothetical protein
MAATIFMILCIAAECFFLYALVHFASDARSRRRRYLEDCGQHDVMRTLEVGTKSAKAQISDKAKATEMLEDDPGSTSAEMRDAVRVNSKGR